VGHGKGMNNHQYSPDKARVIKDESSEAGLGPGEGSGWDISEGFFAGVLQQSSTSFLHHSSTLCSTMPLPCLAFSTPTHTYLVVPLPHSPPPIPVPTTPPTTRSSVV